ncbi:AAA family ATPase, partial [Paraburkholderia sp. BR14261]
MTYQVLARKWRPKDFASLVGQEHVVRALTHALDGGRLHHAYLFTGTRGVGKTTLSRIFAKALNCETGVTSKPCGVCRACREIDEGRFVDYVEMDAASNRGVDEMAALLERAVYAPVDARFKVYMIDEVHMLTNHAFNAMLKTLEEPPPWDDIPPDDYVPLGADDAYFAPPDDGFVPPYDSEPSAPRAAAAMPTPSPAVVDVSKLPPGIALDPIGFKGDWPALAATLSLKGISYQLAFNSELTALEGTLLKLSVPVPQYAEASQVAKLKTALAERLGKTVEV